MKRIGILLLLLSITSGVFSQTTNGFSYQAVLRGSNGQVLANQNVTLRLSLTNEAGTTVYYAESHALQTDARGIVNLVVGKGTVLSGDFSQVPWPTGGVFLKVELSTNGTSYVTMGSQRVTSVPYALYADSAKLSFANNFVVQGNPTSNPDDPIFEVKNAQGEVLFAVYQEGVRVNIKDGVTKGAKGGFAVGGLTGGKADPVEYLRITPDSARVYFRQNAIKGAKGGFAVGGLNGGKGLVLQDLLFVNPDSARFYINEIPEKGAKGGFAVGGLTNGKVSSAQLIQLTKENYFIGHSSGMNIVQGSGKYNSVFGYNSGMELTTGSKNTFIGAFAGKSNTEGSSNVIIGNSAGYSNITGNWNIIIGDSAGFSGNGYRAIVIGNNAGKKANNFFEALYIGNSAGENDISGYPNTFIGNFAGSNNTTGMQNTFIGNSAGFNNTTGFSNVFIGNYAAYNNTSGGQNVFVGENAGYKNTTSGGNSFIGYNSGFNNTTGYGNSFFGNYSGYRNIDGYSNTFIGNGSGSFNEHGVENTYVGQNAGGACTSGSQNTFIGRAAGIAFQTGNGNTFLGYGAGYYKTSGNYNVFIGSYAGAHANGSNRLYISNFITDSTTSLVFGRFDQKTISFDAKVGIGTIDPDKKLHVVGDARITGDIYYGTGNNTYIKPDFVFSDNYKEFHTPLSVERFIRKNGHLPWLTKASDEKDGINLTRMQFETVETVENLQLQIIEQQKEIEILKAELAALKAMLRAK